MSSLGISLTFLIIFKINGVNSEDFIIIDYKYLYEMTEDKKDKCCYNLNIPLWKRVGSSKDLKNLR